MKALRPWDAYDADTMDRVRERDNRASDKRYADHKECCYPGCEEWVRNDASTCPEHRSWYYDETHGNGEQARRDRHHRITSLVKNGMSPVKAVAMVKLIRDWWAKTAE